ncbi:methyltransferase domain-containing protein [Bacteroides sp. 214]|uniref:tRNA1(Val) (adenine(37)-N6)-methyltransferase n=1 Tax=Bacteroides sp. 214 TaxID=2302935 RepID=UPI0013D6DA98|nr:methyltransferase [Bacteroides sp. 214]NDW12710.1 methyltransferase domain-containing protein [Bacteroides sp. 214]
MANSYFRFQQFTIWQDKCAMKVGTDGVLLGAWAPVTSACRVLDIGTGTGLVALMLAQRSEARITAIEIDGEAAEQARENVAQSPWQARIEVLHGDFLCYEPAEKFDLIVSNPPYFVDSLHSPDAQRTNARHNNTLTYDTLLQHAAALLHPLGSIALILPTDVLSVVKDVAEKYHLFVNRQLNIITAPGKLSKRVLVSFTAESQPLKEDELLIEKSRHVYSEEFAKLVEEFYLPTLLNRTNT